MEQLVCLDLVFKLPWLLSKSACQQPCITSLDSSVSRMEKAVHITFQAVHSTIGMPLDLV